MSTHKHTLYLIPGLAADERMFKDLKLEKFELKVLEHEVPEGFVSMENYARQLAKKMNIETPFSLLGVSLGGMLAVEMSKFLQPVYLILVGSAKQRNEIPVWLRLFKYIPIYFILPGWFIKLISKFIFTYIEKSDAVTSAVVRDMIEKENAVYMRRAIHCIVNWYNKTVPASVIHIHGTHDRTLLCSGIEKAIKVDGAGHLIMMTHTQQVEKIIKERLANGI